MLDLGHFNTIHEVVSTFLLCILVPISQNTALLGMNHKSGSVSKVTGGWYH